MRAAHRFGIAVAATILLAAATPQRVQAAAESYCTEFCANRMMMCVNLGRTDCYQDYMNCLSGCGVE